MPEVTNDMKMNKFLYILEYIGLFLWQLPQNLVALVMLPFLGKKELIREEKCTRAYSAKHMAGGISLGNFIFISQSMSHRPEIVAHEFGHCKQSRILGWLYLIVIGLPSIMWAAFKPDGKCYYEFYTEDWANKNAGLMVAKNQYGCYLYIPKKEAAKKEAEKKPEEKKKELSLSDKMSMISHMK